MIIELLLSLESVIHRETNNVDYGFVKQISSIVLTDFYYFEEQVYPDQLRECPEFTPA